MSDRVPLLHTVRGVGYTLLSAEGGERVSLRTRLLAGVLFLVTVALVVAAVSIYAEQRSYLLTHLDQRVIAAATPLSYQLGVDARLLSHHVSPETSSNRAHPAVSPLGRGLAS